MDLARGGIFGKGGVQILTWAVSPRRCLNLLAMPVDMEAAPSFEDSSIRVASSSEASYDTGFSSAYVSR